MGTLYLVRHGQASFGAADYDQLSPLGAQQCRLLGEWFLMKGLRFDAVFTGTLRRHGQSLAAIVEGLGTPLPASALPGLNEYDSEAVVGAVHPQPLGKPDTPEVVRQHFRLLREGLLAWMAGRTQPAGMPSHAQFVAGINEVLEQVRTQHTGHVLIVSSGGPISNAIGQVLGAPHEAVVELNLRMRNSAITEFHFTPRRHALQGYNALPHLDAPERAALVTYS